MNMHTTPGEWILTTTDKLALHSEYKDFTPHIVVVEEKTKTILADFGQVGGASFGNEQMANAVLFSISKNMLDALIAIQETINPAYEGQVDLIAMNTMISDIFAKLANEAGEM